MLIYTVRGGDSVYAIAREYGVSPSRIITDNLLTEPGELVVGQELLILSPTVTHRVRGGDTLERIANEYGVSLLTLYQNNPALDGSPQIFPGQVLNIAYAPADRHTLRTNGYAYPTIEPTVLRRTLPYLSYLSVFSYGIAADGSLIAPVGDVDGLLRAAKEYHTVPLLTLTSLTENGVFSSERVEMVLQDEGMQQKVLDAVAGMVREKGYGGVDVDFEYIPAASSASYAAFLRAMQTMVGEDVVVFVSLAPKSRADQPGLLYAGHDYPSLGEAADAALVMTYEWGYTYGPPRAVSPLPEVRRVLDYAITAIPPQKLYMGVPNYGYDWALPYVRGETKAESLGNVAAVARAREKHAAIAYDEAEQAPTYRYYDRPMTYADAIEHEVWFQNAHSVAAQLQCIEDYDLAGIGVWNIMRYFPALWTIVAQKFSIWKTEG